MRFYVGTVFTNLIRIFVVAMLTCVLTPVPGFVHATTQKCPRVHVLAGLPNCSFFRLLRDTREHMLVDEQTLPSISNPSEAGRGGVTQPCRKTGLLKGGTTRPCKLAELL